MTKQRILTCPSPAAYSTASSHLQRNHHGRNHHFSVSLCVSLPLRDLQMQIISVHCWRGEMCVPLKRRPFWWVGYSTSIMWGCSSFPSRHNWYTTCTLVVKDVVAAAAAPPCSFISAANWALNKPEYCSRFRASDELHTLQSSSEYLQSCSWMNDCRYILWLRAS